MKACVGGTFNGLHDGHKKLYRIIRAAAKKTDRHIPIIGDLQGPKIRLVSFQLVCR